MHSLEAAYAILCAGVLSIFFAGALAFAATFCPQPLRRASMGVATGTIMAGMITIILAVVVA